MAGTEGWLLKRIAIEDSRPPGIGPDFPTSGITGIELAKRLFATDSYRSRRRAKSKVQGWKPMPKQLNCNKCGQLATVTRHVTDPDKLLSVGKALGLVGPAPPYFLVTCAKCGQRIVEVIEEAK